DFAATYRTSPVSGMNVTDPFWGWTQTVSVAGSIVRLTNSPVPGELVRPYGAWNAEVLWIDDAANGGQGVILVHHRLDPTLIDRIGEKSGGKVVFVLTSVDLAAGTYKLDFDTPTKGRTLVFQAASVQTNPPPVG